MIEPNWQARSKCQELDLVESMKMFFLERGQRSTKAKAYCQGKDGVYCPVFQSCLSYAIVYDEEGIWAGTTKDERDNVVPAVKAQLIAEAKASGRYESRRMLDFIGDIDSVPEKPLDSFEVYLSTTVDVSDLPDLLSEVSNFLATGLATTDAKLSNLLAEVGEFTKGLDKLLSGDNLSTMDSFSGDSDPAVLAA